jgi:hypothetical protein
MINYLFFNRFLMQNVFELIQSGLYFIPKQIITLINSAEHRIDQQKLL